MRQAYFDIKVVSPFARSNSSLSPSQLFRKAEQSKIREYADRIRNVEHADFNPLVFRRDGPTMSTDFQKDRREDRSDQRASLLCCVWLASMPLFLRSSSYHLNLS